MSMPIYQYRLQVEGNFSQKGFGFTCLQLAYKNDITGTFFYESDNSVILEITGMEADIASLIECCKNTDYISKIHILNKTKTANKLYDFIMLNQID